MRNSPPVDVRRQDLAETDRRNCGFTEKHRSLTVAGKVSEWQMWAKAVLSVASARIPDEQLYGGEWDRLLDIDNRHHTVRIFAFSATHRQERSTDQASWPPYSVHISPLETKLW
jgi:hypothetical protein